MGLIQAHHNRGVGGEELLVLTAHLIRPHVVWGVESSLSRVMPGHDGVSWGSSVSEASP